ncbi:glycosyltransferase [Martelella radicis]|uniref:Glycosyltransferase involved in cell wall biosynthesis n=1 Tax=Martelella radicis TaxID=1397476 RepID=A0A7W6KKH4_9HYPH|nr:glycosyltransferase [Martelella radicis]MBB4122700.1 glycosyltransferase involved in cell wall biosynthesis [Martelella radicis]
MDRSRNLVFLWDNFGPTHADRCQAVTESLGDRAKIVGLELLGRSSTYDWDPEKGAGFQKVTLFPSVGDDKPRPSAPARLGRMLKFWLKQPRSTWFVCHYDWIDIFLFSLFLRMTGVKIYTLIDSKFDDKKRFFWNEFIKRIFLAPYRGGISCEGRAADYLRFLGLKEERIVPAYDTLSTERIRTLSGAEPAPGGVPFDARHFTIIARLVPKKNISMALKAFAAYCEKARIRRKLVICGSGPLEDDLRREALELGISEDVEFRGFVQTEAIARVLSSSLALILPSTEEQFGLVVVEALAMGVPAVVSDRCGARDSLVRSGVNGFVVEPDNPAGLAWFLVQLSDHQELWNDFAIAAFSASDRGDVKNFVESVRTLAFEQQ